MQIDVAASDAALAEKIAALDDGRTRTSAKATAMLLFFERDGDALRAKAEFSRARVVGDDDAEVVAHLHWLVAERGYGREALRLFERYARDELRARSIELHSSASSGERASTVLTRMNFYQSAGGYRFSDVTYAVNDDDEDGSSITVDFTRVKRL
jgi:hypothetical protein